MVCYARVTEESPDELIFGNEVNGVTNVEGDRSEGGQAKQEEEVQVYIPAFFYQNIQTDDPYLTSAAQAGLINVDGDNDTVPENILNPGFSVDNCRYNDEWDHDGIFFRRVIRTKYRKSRLLHHYWNLKITNTLRNSNKISEIIVKC